MCAAVAEGGEGVSFPVVIHHNPDCGTSRNVLKIIRAAGIEPTVIDYQATGWTRPQLVALFAAAGLTARAAMRTTKSPAAELGLLAPDISDGQLLDAMRAHPILVNRPFVATPKGVRLCRPSEVVLDLLDRKPPGPLAKEDGELIIAADDRRTVAPPPAQDGRFAVRQAVHADAAAIAAIYNEGIADRIATFETEPRTSSDVSRWFDGRHPVAVAADPGGEIAAYAAAFAYSDRCAYSGVAEFSVYARRSHRGRGAGRAALLSLLAAAPEAGLWKLTSRVFVENAPSRALLRSVGFREVGVQENHGRLDGRWRDVIVVERLI
jgi:arsenate reductase (glutaredoxin)